MLSWLDELASLSLSLREGRPLFLGCCNIPFAIPVSRSFGPPPQGSLIVVLDAISLLARCAQMLNLSRGTGGEMNHERADFYPQLGRFESWDVLKGG